MMETNYMDETAYRNSGKNPFLVPEDYFTALEDKVMKRIEEDKKPRRGSLVQSFKPYLGLAAFFAVAILMVQFIIPHFIDHERMLIKGGEGLTVKELKQESAATELDPDFNPTNDEIIEYLVQETDLPDLLLVSMR